MSFLNPFDNLGAPSDEALAGCGGAHPVQSAERERTQRASAEFMARHRLGLLQTQRAASAAAGHRRELPALDAEIADLEAQLAQHRATRAQEMHARADAIERGA